MSRECGPYDPPEGLHLNPIALAHVGNDLGREGSHLVALKSLYSTMRRFKKSSE